MIISPLVINQLYTTCLLSSQEMYHESITVPGFQGKAHTFRKERLTKQYSSVLSAIKKLPRVMLHSQSPAGVPWILARSRGSHYDGCTLEVAERLLVMGIALNIVRVVKSTSSAYDVPYVVIDDDRLIRTELMKPEAERRDIIARWHK